MAKTQSKPAEPAPSKLPTHNVYVIDGEGENAFWTKVGAAWKHGDGDGFDIQLTAVPLTGRLVLRTRKDKDGAQ